MSGSFPYKNRKGQIENLPTEPSFFQKAYENAAYPADVDRQREAYKKAQNSLAGGDAPSTMPVPGVNEAE